jgi:uncharacterized protein (DUF1330 family)
MKKSVLYSISIIVIFVLGHLSAHLHDAMVYAQGKPAGEKAAYLIAGIKARQASPERMAAYRDAAGPLARQAGMQMLASGESARTVQVLEGKWPYDGRIAVEKFRSMKALLDFWNSPEYQKAKTLREEAHFIVALEAVE